MVASLEGKKFDGKIYLCHPGYGGGQAASHRAFWMGPSRKGSPLMGKCMMTINGGSLLANSFNGAWAHALTLQEEGHDIRLWGMLHDDVVPDDGWLDDLYSVMLETGADVVSAVIPIKDPLGLTSTAIDDPKNPFQVERRLTLTEVHRLPETFTAADCGYPDRRLLVNTGCWLCRFDRDWRKQVRFTINDKITCEEQPHPTDPSRVRKSWKAWVAPEDWNFSRDVQALGAKVVATRAVKLFHAGEIPYSNTEKWGLWEYDELLGPKFGNKPVRPDLVPTNGSPSDHVQPERTLEKVKG